MTTEEKAKAYDEVLNKLRRFIAQGVDPLITRADVQDFFPELAESEDEKIRKELIEFVKSRGWFKQEYFVWLEKQAEQNTVVVIPKFRVGDVIRHKGSTAEYTIESISGECYHGKGWGLHISGEEDYELVEQNTCSEEDETMITDLSVIVHTYFSEISGIPFKYDLSEDKIRTWLKSLKDRALPQPKQEWSEEDESHIRYLIECLEHCKKGVALTMTTSTSQEYINWLKSLRPQNRWKPSDEQIKALDFAIDCTVYPEFNIQRSVLKELLEQLKKLREE